MEYNGDERRKEWYSNQQLFEMIVSLKDTFAVEAGELKDELRNAITAVRKYNCLQEKLTKTTEMTLWCYETLKAKESETTGKTNLTTSFREWGAWLFKLVTTLIAIYYLAGALSDKILGG